MGIFQVFLSSSFQIFYFCLSADCFEDMADEVDSEAARVVDKVIDDLPMMQKNAIYIIFLGQKSMMDTRVLEYYYDNALMMLQRKLKEKNLY